MTSRDVQEMNNVFGNYGIKVNPRHLTLVADYMTFTGAVTPFARSTMTSSASPLQKMTFETTMQFMRDAIVSGEIKQGGTVMGYAFIHSFRNSIQ